MYGNNDQSAYDWRDDRYTSGQKRKSDHNYNPSSKKPRQDERHYHQNGASRKHHGQQNSTKYDSGTPRQPREPLPELPPIGAEYEMPVFTHPSMTPSDLKQSIMGNYDRLEFLGDAYLEIISSRLIWSLYKDYGFSAARMSQVRQSLIMNETLSEYSLGYGFDKKLNTQDQATSLTGRTKINGDVFEAYVAAVVLSDPRNGFETCEDWLTKLWEPKLRNVSTELPDENSKIELQKRIGFKDVLISYVDERDANIDKRRGIETYFQGVYLSGWGYEKKLLGRGQGQSKKAAGMAAAKNALEDTEIIEELMAKKVKAQAQKEAEEQKAEDAG